jgi:hypothetical protein
MGRLRRFKYREVYMRGEFEQRAGLPVSFERTVKTKGRLLYAA